MNNLQLIRWCEARGEISIHSPSIGWPFYTVTHEGWAVSARDFGEACDMACDRLRNEVILVQA